MSRQTRRVSRPLIVILLLSIVLAGLSIVHKLNRPGVAAATPPPAQTAQTSFTPPPPTLAPADDPSTRPTPQTTNDVPAPQPDAPRAQQAADFLTPATAPSFSASSLLADAQSQIAQGKLLQARGQLNDALQSGQLDDSQTAAFKADISQISQTVVFGRQHFADDIYGGTYVVQPGDSLARIALAHDTTWELLGRINGIDARHLRAGATIKVIEGPFFAVVDKRKFTMDIYLGSLPGEKSSMYVTTYRVGLGRDDSTPVGTWMIEPHRKLKHPTYYSPRGDGVIAADDPKNPLGGYWIGLTGTQGQAVGKLSYGIHGTIDPDSIGKQSSMGCIRLRPDDIAMVYDLMVEGKSMVVVTE